MRKKQNIILGLLLTLTVLLFASFNFLTKIKFDVKKIKGDISQTHTGNVWITCTSDTVKVNQSINCTLMGRSNGTVKSVQGMMESNSNISISVVKSNNFSNGNNGYVIGYYNGNISGNTDFEISNITVTGISAGTGSISFGSDGNAIFGDDEYNDVPLSGTSKNITVESEVIESDNNYLASLSISSGSISFDKTVTEYNVTVPYSVSNITVTAIKEDNSANIESGTGSHDLNVGNNPISIVVRAQNGTPRTYTINVTREARTPSSDATLTNLTVSGANIGIFSPSQTSYTATVENSVTSVNISATGCEGSSVSGDLGDKTLYVKTNKFIIHVTAENGTTTKDYVVNIIRKSSSGGSGLSSVNTLSYLSVSNTKIATKFSPNVTSYTASVGHSVTSVTISATATEKNKAVVTGTGTFQLKEGTNNYNVICTAEDGTPNIYRVSITREAKSSNNSSSNNSNNSNNSRTQSTKDNNSILKELTINNKKINITDGTFSYKYTVLYKTNSLTVKAIPKSNKATVSINGDKELQVGKNAVTITVTAEDGSSSMYVVTVTRKDEEEELSKDATLDTLVIDGYDLKFEPSKYTYDLKIGKEKHLDITYSASNTNSNVVITGNEDLISGSAINIIVTAEDGSSSKYTINIKKGPSILKIVLIIILGLLLVGGVLAAYYFLILIKRDKKSAAESEEVQSFNNDVFITDNNLELPEEENKEEEVNKEDNENLPFEKID